MKARLALVIAGLMATAAGAQECRAPEIARELLPTAPGSGRHSVAREGRFTDHYLWGPGERMKIGVREDWGGSIVYFGAGDGAAASNAIDAHDAGREVQVALYDPDRQRQGCAHDASCRRRTAPACPDSISYMGWNPTQGGNKCNRGSPVLRVEAHAGALEVETATLQWNPDWLDAACGQRACASADRGAIEAGVRLRQRLRFVDENVVEIELEARNLGDEAHAPAAQEFPTLYGTYGARGTQNLERVLDSSGTLIAVDRPANDGFFVREFSSAGGWAMLQNAARSFGVGLYMENGLQQWQGWQRPGIFNNVRAIFRFGLPARGVVRARSYLILGDAASIARRAERLTRELPPFGKLDPPQRATSGAFALSGWALDNSGVREVELRIDGRRVAAVPSNARRAGLCRLWPGYAGCRSAGFSASVTLAADTACSMLEAIAIDVDGNRAVIGRAALAR